MVDDNAPLAVDLVEEEGIDAADIAGLSFQKPFPYHKIIVGGKSFYFQQVEEKLAHLFGALVILFIVRKGMAIAIAWPGFPDKDKGVVVPVAFHEGFDIAFVPGGNLVGH